MRVIAASWRHPSTAKTWLRPGGTSDACASGSPKYTKTHRSQKDSRREKLDFDLTSPGVGHDRGGEGESRGGQPQTGREPDSGFLIQAVPRLCVVAR
jgi:hypothetical protein